MIINAKKNKLEKENSKKLKRKLLLVHYESLLNYNKTRV